MQKSSRFLAVIALLASSSAWAASSPVLDMPMNDWNYSHEPAVQGGAKSIEEVTVYGGKPSKSKYVITLDGQGRPVRSELVTEGSPKIYVTTFKRDGDLLEVTQVIVEDGKETVNSRQKGTYAAKGQLSSISAERCLTKMELQPEGTTTVETAADGTATLTMQDAKGREQMKLVVGYDPSGRASKCAMIRGGRTETVAIVRNAAGLIESATPDRGPVTTVQYEMDAKGNWTKATVTQTMKGQDGKEMKQTKEVLRKITY